MAMVSRTPKEHIEEIRRNKFSIGGELNPLTEDLHYAVKNLAAELYAKDVHFLMELIQNAEDNQYSEGVNPTLEFIITSEDITATGAPATLLIFNNEKGFSPRNIESICSVGRSTKKGNRSSGFIGEKGIGFKSVFLVTAQPYIFSNGYQIRFNERPCPHCNLGYIVPEWVEEKPTIVDIKQIYGASKDSLPTTTIVLPLKSDKVNPVKQQLSSIHPEVLLFLSKVRHLYVRKDNEDPELKTVSSVSISSEINFVTRKNINAESYTLHLSAAENCDAEKECSYYMWKQKFPVSLENVVERRMDVGELVVTLAFPNHERLHRGKSLPGVYAFLPTEMVTNFPFIIQADFVLTSSRESILLDDKWNIGILECIPSAFMDAFKTVVVGSDQAPVSCLPPMFRFLPIDSSPFEKLNYVRNKIKAKLLEENIVPTETYTEHKHFCKPLEVGRLLPEFWSILTNTRAEGVNLLNPSSHDGKKILSSSFDESKYDHILSFLGVIPVSVDWYANFIQRSNLVNGVSEDVYIQLLLFIAKNWISKFKGSNMMNIPLIKYVAFDGNTSFSSLHECLLNYVGAKRVVLADSSRSCPCSWLINWNKEFACASNRFFMPESTQQAILRLPLKNTLLEWLGSQVNVASLNAYALANILCSCIKYSSTRAIAYANFLYYSWSKGYLSGEELRALCSSMPLVDNYGNVTEYRKGVLVPADVSKWADLIVSNPWRNEYYVELGKCYLDSYCYAGQCTDSGELIKFLKTHVGASDIPYLSPPNAGFSIANTPLSKDNAFLLLDWIQNLKYKGVKLPVRFLNCIKEGKWLKVTVDKYMPPSKSFLIGLPLVNILQSSSALVDIPLIDESFYGGRIKKYEEELKTMGVMFTYVEACEFIGRQLKYRNLSRSHVLLVLNIIQCLRRSSSRVCLDKFVNNMRQGSWLKTSHYFRSTVGSVLNDSGWHIASQISDIPFIDQVYLGDEIYSFKEELKLLGVIVGFYENYPIVIEYLKSPSNLVNLTAEAVLLIMKCIRFLKAPSKLLYTLRVTCFLKTNMGFRTPSDCFLYDPVWGSILEVFNDKIPVIDHKFYGENIFTYKVELKQISVVVDYENALQKFSLLFRQKASEASFNQQNVELFLFCYRKLKGTKYGFPSDFSIIISNEKWLKTNMGFRTPGECFLYDSEWGCILEVFHDELPVIDHEFYGEKIFTYKDELKQIGVVVDYENAIQKFSLLFRQKTSQASFNKQIVELFLSCYGQLKQTKYGFPSDFSIIIHNEKWLKTNIGFRTPGECFLYDSEWGCILEVFHDELPVIDHEFYGEKIFTYKDELKQIGVVVDYENAIQKFFLLFRQKASQASFNKQNVELFLSCYRQLKETKYGFPSDFSIIIHNGKWLKTNIGFRTPDECFLYDSVWGCTLEVFNDDFPVIDHEFYGEKIFTYKDELKQIGVVVDFENAIQKFSLLFKQKVSQASFNQQNVELFLSCCRLLKGTKYGFPSDFSITIHSEKWLHTVAGGYRCPRECILYGPEWKTISSITSLPFIDDSDNYYGMGIHEYREELKSFGVVTELKDGVRFVPECLNFPSDPSTFAPESVLSLLECIQILMQEGKFAFEDEFRERLSKNWLKTHVGYRPPDECLFVDSKWFSFLKFYGPFIDENFYGPEIASYKKELNAIGVIVELEQVDANNMFILKGSVMLILGFLTCSGLWYAGKRKSS